MWNTDGYLSIPERGLETRCSSECRNHSLMHYFVYRDEFKSEKPRIEKS